MLLLLGARSSNQGSPSQHFGSHIPAYTYSQKNPSQSTFYTLPSHFGVPLQVCLASPRKFIIHIMSLFSHLLVYSSSLEIQTKFCVRGGLSCFCVVITAHLHCLNKASPHQWGETYKEVSYIVIFLCV